MKHLKLIMALVSLSGISHAATESENRNKGLSTLLTVGTTADCTHNSITAAINDPQEASEIRVTNEIVYAENLQIERSLVLKGGYSSCADAINDVREEGVKTWVDAQNLGNALYFNASDSILNISGFLFENGVARGVSPVLATSGAVTMRGSQLNATITDSIIRNSQGILAGGVQFVSTSGSLTLDNTLITENLSESNGGGITCTGLFSTIYLNNQSGVSNNVANADGGGVFLSSCDIHLNSGVGGKDSEINTIGISANSAADSGGGIYAVNATLFTPDASNVDAHPINIDNNMANTDAVDQDGDGGGVFLLNSSIEVNNLFVNKNTVINGDGGGLYLDDSLLAVSESLPYVDNYCALNGFTECNLFRDNQAIQGLNTDGGAIYMTNNSTMAYNLSYGMHANFQNNYADNGSVIDLNDGSSIRIQNAYFVENGTNESGDTFDFSVIDTDLTSDAYISHSTLVNNQSKNVFKGNVNLINAIVNETSSENQVVTEPNLGTFESRCTVFHENDSFDGPLFGNSVVSQDPGFIDPAVGNYHLRYDSIAIDRCLDNDSTLLGPDRDGDERGVDLPFITNQPPSPGNYYFDAGGDEFNAADTPQETIIVGEGAGCDVTEIGFAISIATPGSEVRVTNQSIHSGGINVDRSLTLKGGYSSCANAVDDIRVEGEKTTVTGGNFQNTFYVIEDDITLDMSGFVLTNGKNTAVPELKGGAMTIGGNNTNVTLTDLLMQNSFTDVSGGGIRLGGTNNQLTLDNTLVLNNEANLGGGIRCISASTRNEVHLNNQSGVTLNTASGTGGGLNLNNCDLYLRSGIDNVESTINLIGISANTSASSGGGIYAYSSSIYTPNSGADARPINIDNNTASGPGGGVFVNDSEVEVTQLLLNRNNANIAGGAFFGESIIISDNNSDRTEECINNGYDGCNLFINNQANRSGVFELDNSSMLNVLHSIKGRFENNRADEGGVATLFDGELRLQNSLIIDNGANGTETTTDQNVFHVEGIDSTLEAYFSTLADNNTLNVFETSAGGSINLHKSIVYEDFINENVWLSGTPGLDEFNFSCSLFHENNSIGSLEDSTGSIVTQTPGFIDAENGDYHLSLDSPAIERCTDFGLTVVTTDRDTDERGQDYPGISNGTETFYDAGYDEVNAASSDVIFKNGFE